MRPLPLALAAALLLAGCAGAPDAETQAEDIDFGDVSATETTGVIRGVVVDLAIRPLAGALVTVPVQGANRTATTGDDGQFAFSQLEPGTYFLLVSLAGYTSVQQSAEVAAGDSEPPIVKIGLERLPSAQPFLETYHFTGFLTFGGSIGITSVGSTINPALSESINDQSIWNVQVPQVPTWAQGELVWDQTQPAGGMLIWEMVHGGTNSWRGHRETATSPALAYWNTTVLANEENLTADGIDYRFFGGPHPLLAPGAGIVPTRDSGHPACTTFPTVVLGDRSLCSFGYGITYQQRADGYIHNFYNFAPPEGWRFTVHGDPVVPTVA